LTHKVEDDRLKKIKENNIKTLIMTGTDDCLVDPKNSKHLAENLEGILEIFEGSGHVIGSEKPSKFNQRIEQFVFHLQ
jgi:pimeloyl-ACP methyl ester carboxylesterase